MTTTANWSYPTSIRFGEGRISELAEACQKAGIRAPLFVTDPGIADLPITRTALDVLQNAGIDAPVFSDVQANPTATNVEAGLLMMRNGGHDGVIAFGGGSALDAAKVIAFMMGQTRPMWDFEDVGDWWTRANPDGIAPIIAVPTTAGTGSEVGRAGVITNEETQTKKVIFHPKMLPVDVICDPALSADLPPVITVGTGMDAYAHCIEAYCAPSYHPMSEGIAIEGMRLVRENLPKVFRDGHDLEARGHMLSAAAMGAVAFQKGLGGIHALSHPVGAIYHTHHGLTNAVFMPYVLVHNRAAIEDKIERVASFLGIAGGFNGFLDDVLRLREDLGVVNTTKELGVDDAQVARMSEMAVVDPTAGGNPIELTVADCNMLYERTYNGTLAA